MRASLRMGRSADTQAANQPDYDGTDQYQAKNAAKAGPAIPAVTIVAAASEQTQKSQRCGYFPLSVSLRPPTAFWTFPAAWSALPSDSSLASPSTLPATSLTLPMIPLCRSFDPIFETLVTKEFAEQPPCRVGAEREFRFERNS
jgi:hypothetical protein